MDDLFVIIQTWDNVCGEKTIDKDEDIPLLVSKTMKHAVCTNQFFNLKLRKR